MKPKRGKDFTAAPDVAALDQEVAELEEAQATCRWERDAEQGLVPEAE